MRCPGAETLSAYADREAAPEERAQVEGHLPGCAPCRRSLALLARLKSEVRRQPTPPLPEDLRRELEGMVPRPPEPGPGWRAWLRSAWTPALLTAGALASLALWLNLRTAEEPVPADFVLAAHRHYALTLPLAETDRILAEMPVLVASAEATDAR